MNAALESPVAIALPPLTPRPPQTFRKPPQPVRGDRPRRIGLVMAEVLARHGLDDSAIAATANPHRSA
jgi:hypothetical protein